MAKAWEWAKENFVNAIGVIGTVGGGVAAYAGHLYDAFLDHPGETIGLMAMSLFIGLLIGYNVGRQAFRVRQARRAARVWSAEERKLARRILRESKVDARHCVAVMFDSGEIILPDNEDSNCMLSGLFKCSMVEYENTTANFGYGTEAARIWTLTERGMRACEENPDAILRPPDDIAEYLRCGCC